MFVRRALDAKNADRARLLLAMTWLAHVDPTDDAIGRAASLLDERPDVRSAVSPAAVVKYLASRGTPAKLRRFRRLRTRLQEACAHAQKAMLDHRGLLNPGMMPRTLDDLERIAPIDALDAHRISLWNRVSEVWRQEEDFRRAVLRYATRSDHLESAGANLWPEVVYPLIERTHWQRTSRPRYMALWEYLLGTLLRVPLPGVRLDRMLGDALPPEVARQLDDDLDVFIDDFRLDEAEEGTQEIPKAARARPIYVGGNIPREEEYASDDEFPAVRPTIPLTPAEPFRVAHGVLRAMWEGAIEEQTYAAPTPTASRTLPVGPYCLAVVPTIRGRSAVRAVLKCRNQGKEIEIMTPILGRTADARTVIAVWVYQDESVAVAHLDFQSRVRYIFWHATKAHQVNFAYPDELRLNLSSANLEVPEAIEQTLRT
jgi:serine/threonine-protein kinase